MEKRKDEKDLLAAYADVLDYYMYPEDVDSEDYDFESHNDYGCSNEDQSYCQSLPQCICGVMGDIVVVSATLGGVAAVTVAVVILALVMQNVRGNNCVNIKRT